MSWAAVEAVLAVIGAVTVGSALLFGAWIAICELARRPAHRMTKETRARTRIQLWRKP